jgi:TetR/AcrR family transcriptional repressor of nem operon
MGTKGERTRAEIIRRSAELMNRHGFLAAPMAEVVAATGIQKGGLYRHFESREALAYEAFDHAVLQVRERFMHALQGRSGACEQLIAMLDAYAGDGADVPLAGGCPIMNSAIESDHAHPGLRARAQAAMHGWHGLIQRIVEAGLKAGEIRAGVDPRQTASVFIACVEGAVMLSHLHADTAHLAAARRHLTEFVNQRLRADPGVRP